MMRDSEREQFTREASALAAETRIRGQNVEAALAPKFRAALLHHPDDEERLLEIWDEVTCRAVL